jgi:hypothetical protein
MRTKTSVGDFMFRVARLGSSFKTLDGMPDFLYVQARIVVGAFDVILAVEAI